jgi:hypothetical protein
MALIRNNLPDQLRAWSGLVAARAAVIATPLARSDHRVPMDTGRLRRNTVFGQPRVAGTRATVTARNPVEYASFTDTGSPPHTIRPRGRVLRFPSGGGVVFARYVNHPGTKGTRWWQPVLETAWDTALRTAARSTPLPPA